MRDDELQILGAEVRKRKRNKWLKTCLAVVGVVFMVIVIELSVRDTVTDWLIKVVGETPVGELGGTINPRLQQVADSLLTAQLEEIIGEQGQVIVMEVQTGEIKAIAGRERRFDGSYQPCVNFCYSQLPGSTVKTASLLAALETGKAKLTDKINTQSGIWDADGTLIKDHNWRRGGYGVITLDRVMEVSSNIGICKTIQKVFKGDEQHYFDLLEEMSFGQPDSIEGLEGLTPISFISPKDSSWVNKRLLWNAIGYEQEMAPIQTLTFYNAIANNGKMVKPTLRSGNTEVINEQIASPENIKLMQQVLYNVVAQGLGRKAGSLRISVAGKTGTAILSPVYTDEEIIEYHLSFCGYVPADRPKYSIIVSLNKLGLPASGGGMAGPVFHEIVEWMIDNNMIEGREQ